MLTVPDSVASHVLGEFAVTLETTQAALDEAS